MYLFEAYRARTNCHYMYIERAGRYKRNKGHSTKLLKYGENEREKSVLDPDQLINQQPLRLEHPSPVITYRNLIPSAAMPTPEHDVHSLGLSSLFSVRRSSLFSLRFSGLSFFLDMSRKSRIFRHRKRRHVKCAFSGTLLSGFPGLVALSRCATIEKDCGRGRTALGSRRLRSECWEYKEEEEEQESSESTSDPPFLRLMHSSSELSIESNLAPEINVSWQQFAPRVVPVESKVNV